MAAGAGPVVVAVAAAVDVWAPVGLVAVLVAPTVAVTAGAPVWEVAERVVPTAVVARLAAATEGVASIPDGSSVCDPR